ncbi:MAG TPA: GreA/GreB family elongation factor [Prolixibacteraceae bacterium]|nr:GreA/GreB family elongation factor [Prolixibacteraceae bacterium]
MKATLQITQLDYVRLNNLIQSLKSTKKEEVHNLETLENEIFQASKVDSKEITPDYVTMNSELEVVDVDTNRTMKIKLVYPHEADFKLGRVSVLSPLGSALIGYREGDQVSFKVPMGLKKVRISKILYQPEAAGEFLL